MTVRGRVLVAAAAAMAVGLSGCSLLGLGDSGAPATPLPAASRTAPPGSEALAPFYSQTLAWRSCGEGAQCAGLKVPVDYAHPEQQSITIQVLRMRATKPSARLGSLVVDPGGPGASGVDYARAADYIVGQPVRQQFDIVGLDPRGVQRSEPVDCLPDPELDAFLGQDPTPDTAAEEAAMGASDADFAAGCQQRMGALLGHISTVETAKDLDILRSALGEAQLNYLGKSYGTLIGSTYAGLFPKQVGRFVLDGVVPPDLDLGQIALGQAEGFERATRAWAADCVGSGDCPLGDSVDSVMAGMRELLRSLDQQPIPMSDGRLSHLTEGWAASGIAQAMYEPRLWPTLTSALRQVVNDHNGTKLMGLADQYAERSPTGRYTGNLMEAYYAITCLDYPDSPDPQVYEQRAKEAEVKAPTWGASLVWGALVCGHWPVSTGAKPHTISAAGSGPIVVVGTTRDPATPYEWSVHLRDQLQNARLLTLDGDGHTAYGRHNDCIDGAIDDYYTQGTVPPDGLKC